MATSRGADPADQCQRRTGPGRCLRIPEGRHEMMLGFVLLAGPCRGVTAGPLKGVTAGPLKKVHARKPSARAVIYRYADLKNYVR
jgi:hypothetical protein